MHIKHNLDHEKPILDQIQGFAVAVNYMNPKPEDFHYKYSELSQEHRDVLFGMAWQIDNLDTFNEHREVDILIDEIPPSFANIRDEIETKVMENAYEWLIIEMCEVLISFGDEEACDEE